jgi:hypothetical protein
MLRRIGALALGPGGRPAGRVYLEDWLLRQVCTNSNYPTLVGKIEGQVSHYLMADWLVSTSVAM